MKLGAYISRFALTKWRSTLSVALFTLAWETISRLGIFPKQLFPPPSIIVFAVIDMLLSESIWSDAGASLFRAYGGLLIGIFIGVVFGVFTGRNKVVSQSLSVLFNIFRQLPPVSLIPLMIVWFGIGDLAKIISISFAVFFPVWLNCHAGCLNIPVSYFWLAQTGHVGRLRTLIRIILPASASYIMVGIRGGIATAFIMVFVSELAGASSGLGYQISIAHLSYKIDRMIGLMLILASCGAITDCIFTQVFNFVCPWLRNEVEQ